MISAKILLVGLSALPAAYCHFRLPFPGERDPTNFGTQGQGPCGGSNSVVEPRYGWSPDGSPMEIHLSHPLSVGGIYYCPGDNCNTLEDFNVTLFETWSVDGSGNYCIPALEIPFDVGSIGTIQVAVANAGDEEGIYEEFFNCIDVVIGNGPTYNGSQCSNSSSVDIGAYPVNSDRVYNATNIAILDEFLSSELAAASASEASAASTSAISGSVASPAISPTAINNSSTTLNANTTSSATLSANMAFTSTYSPTALILLIAAVVLA